MLTHAKTPLELFVEDLFTRHYAHLVRYVRRLVGDLETARDIAQETFMSAYRVGGVSSEKPLTKAWLYRTAINNAISVLRRKRSVAFVPLREDDAAAEPAFEERVAEHESVLKLLSILPNEQRDAIMLCVHYGCSSSEAAELLHTTAPAVRQRVSRGLRRLREAAAQPPPVTTARL